VEEQLYQVKNRSAKDPLNYPVKLNNRLASLQRVVENSDAKPTDQTRAVLDKLSAELQAQLAKLDAAVATDLPALNKVLAARKLAAIDPSWRPAKAETKAAPRPIDPDEIS
jgi:hypothetical protein